MQTSHPAFDTADKQGFYNELRVQLAALLEGERDWIANTANCAALLYQFLPDINWVGFYLLKDADLVLGPFQGKPACVRIALGKGVCGAAAQRKETLVVPNVHEFPGHIACDVASNAEIVVPLIDGQRLLGVLDIDSPQVGRFDHQDAEALQSIADVVITASDA